MQIEFLGRREYGGWNTATEGLGPESVVYSFGVGEDISWDLAMIERFGCRVFAYDPDPTAAKFIARTQPTDRLIFSPVGIASYDGTAKFWWRPGKSSSTVKKLGTPEELPVRALATLMNERGHARIDVLKLDIEGSEFSVLPAIAALPIKQILVEVHTRFYRYGLKGLRRLWGEYREWRMMRALKRAGFVLVARHNDDFTFCKS